MFAAHCIHLPDATALVIYVEYIGDSSGSRKLMLEIVISGFIEVYFQPWHTRGRTNTHLRVRYRKTSCRKPSKTLSISWRCSTWHLRETRSCPRASPHSGGRVVQSEYPGANCKRLRRWENSFRVLRSGIVVVGRRETSSYVSQQATVLIKS